MTRWQVFGAVALRRLPEVISKRDPIHMRVHQIFESIEVSKSRYSQHELQHLQDIKMKEDESLVQAGETAQDREDRWLKEKESFKFAEYDDRLAKTQYLFIHSRFGTDVKDQWLLPQTTFDRELGDKNLIDTARRALKESLNMCNGYTIVSKIPSSVCSIKYPKKVQEITGYDGSKVFFLKAHLDLPDASVLEALDTSKNERLRWMTQDEAVAVVPKTYMSSFSSGLLSERCVDESRVLNHAAQYVNTIKKLSVSVKQ